MNSFITPFLWQHIHDQVQEKGVQRWKKYLTSCRSGNFFHPPGPSGMH